MSAEATRIQPSDAAAGDCRAKGWESAWRCTGLAVRGQRHAAYGTPCQDAQGWAWLNSTFIAATADGAGSAMAAERGASLAVETAIDFLVKSVLATPAATSDVAFETTLHKRAAACVAAVHRELSQVAGDDELRPGDLATTLLVAMVTEHHTVVAQVGDGAIVGAFDGSEPVALTRPWHGDFINETCFVTQDDYLANAQIHVFEGAARHVALFSDGLESVALQWATGEVMRPLFARLFEFMTATPCAEIRREAVRRLLEQGPVAARSDDDKALVLATRGPSHQVTGS